MPQLGESVVEGTITRWLKAKGDQVLENEALLEVNTDKVDTEIPSPASGILLDILVADGITVQAGALLGWIGEAAEAMPQPRQSMPAAAVEVTPPAQPSVQDVVPPLERRESGFISPVVSKIAMEYQVDLAQVQGSGEGGRITKKDILAYVERQREQGRQLTPAPGVAAPMISKSAPPKELDASLPAVPAPAHAEPAIEAPLLPGDELVPLSSIRRSIAGHMVLSKHTSPHVTTVMEVDLSRVVAHRDANKKSFAVDGVNLTYTAYFVMASVAALKAFPVVNSSWSEAGLVLHRSIHIGMAASMGEAGLIVPVIKNADAFSLLGLARTINDLAARAKARQLKPEEVKGGTFTITNHGTSGSLFATPIINQPQCGILGVGAIQKRVVVLSSAGGGDSLAIRPMVYLSFTFDHRILDGAVADAFLGKVVESLRDWS
jgi:2-oxoglutarate dehydrogenase E2 component (dihydrolipoamide succinyltransferase)